MTLTLVNRTFICTKLNLPPGPPLLQMPGYSWNTAKELVLNTNQSIAVRKLNFHPGPSLIQSNNAASCQMPIAFLFLVLKDNFWIFSNSILIYGLKKAVHPICTAAKCVQYWIWIQQVKQFKLTFWFIHKKYNIL